jgi:hypothetical protein
MKEELKLAIEAIQREGIKILEAQGHKNTGNLIATMKTVVDEASSALYGDQYGLAQETGIKAANHPFKGGKGGVSAYIEAITKWVQNKGIESDIIKAKGIAFAIGKSQSGKGLIAGSGTGMHSTKGVFDSSKQGWLSSAISNTEDQVDRLISDGALKNINIVVENIIKKANLEAKRNYGK